MSDEIKSQTPAPSVRLAKASNAKKRGRRNTMTNIPTSNSQADEPIVGQDIQSHLGHVLKASYEEILREPVPNKFHELLKELERREKN